MATDGKSLTADQIKAVYSKGAINDGDAIVYALVTENCAITPKNATAVINK